MASQIRRNFRPATPFSLATPSGGGGIGPKRALIKLFFTSATFFVRVLPISQP
jgi:hypothetical protein